jgi:hypothetical protein
VHRVLERSSAALRPSAARERRALRARYRRVAEALYGALATVAGASHVVDSSHFPLRARELQALAGIELQLVFLVRDPQAVVTSITRLGDRHSVLARGAMLLKANANLWITYALSLSVFLRQPRERRIFLRYEDFIADPESALRRIIRASGSAAAVPDLGALRTGLAIHGNRLIESDVVELRRGGPVTSARGSSWLTALLQRPWDALFARLARPR